MAFRRRVGRLYCRDAEGAEEGQTRRLTWIRRIPNLGVMEVKLSPELEAKLARLATAQGRDSEALVVEAVERMIDYDEWFDREVDRGISAADRGEFVEHADVKKLIDRRYPG